MVVPCDTLILLKHYRSSTITIESLIPLNCHSHYAKLWDSWWDVRGSGMMNRIGQLLGPNAQVGSGSVPLVPKE